MSTQQPMTVAKQPTSDPGGIIVVIPVLNEEASIGLVLTDLPLVDHVIVVDNGSTDRTADVARRMGAEVVFEPQRGYGAACLRGLAAVEAWTCQSGSEPHVIVFLDGDYSDHPEQLPSLVKPIVDGTADLVLGSRLLGDRERGAMPMQSVWGNRLACWLMARIFGGHYTDLGPFRAVDYRRLKRLNMQDTNFGWTIEMQLKALQQHLRVLEVPVSYRCRVGRSKISGTLWGTVRAGSKILYVIGRYAVLLRFRRSHPAT